MTLSSLSNFITTRLGHMKAWVACNSLDWVKCFPLHFTLAYIEYRESRTRHTYCLHTCTLWRPRWNIHWNRQSFYWFVTLFSNKNDYGFGCQTRSTNILSPERAVVCRVHRDSTCSLKIVQMSGQFSWSRHWANSLLNAVTENGRLYSWKTAGRGLCKIRAVWTVVYFRLFLYNTLRYKSWTGNYNLLD